MTSPKPVRHRRRPAKFADAPKDDNLVSENADPEDQDVAGEVTEMNEDERTILENYEKHIISKLQNKETADDPE